MAKRLRFSEREGIIGLRGALQTDSLDPATRNRLWNAIVEFLPGLYDSYADKDSFYRRVWDELFSASISELEHTRCFELKRSLGAKFRDVWQFHLCLDFLELLAESNRYRAERINRVLEEEGTIWRLVGNQMTTIIEPEQREAIEHALVDSSVSSGARSHLASALGLLRPHGAIDAAAVVREAIHAVEAQAKHVTGDDSATLPKALRSIEATHQLHPALKTAFEKLYAYTSDEAGIRHALLEADARVSTEDALFFVVACSAFVSWLASQLK